MMIMGDRREHRDDDRYSRFYIHKAQLLMMKPRIIEPRTVLKVVLMFDVGGFIHANLSIDARDNFQLYRVGWDKVATP